MQQLASRQMAHVLGGMLGSNQYDLLDRFCSSAGERALKRLCAPPEGGNAYTGWAKAQRQLHASQPYVTCITMHVVTEGGGRGLVMYAGCSDGRLNSLHFHFGETVRSRDTSFDDNVLLPSRDAYVATRG